MLPTILFVAIVIFCCPFREGSVHFVDAFGVCGADGEQRASYNAQWTVLELVEAKISDETIRAAPFNEANTSVDSDIQHGHRSC